MLGSQDEADDAVQDAWLRPEMRSVDAVTRVFAGGAKAARLSLIDGLAGAVPVHTWRGAMTSCTGTRPHHDECRPYGGDDQ